MSLHSLLRQFDSSFPLSAIAEVTLTGVQEDSRLVRPGNLFLARPGTKTDGARFVADALARGAAAVISQTPIAGCSAPVVVVPDVAAAASRLANIYHGQPSADVKVLGVTGTNGKTTTTYLIRHLLAKAKQHCGLIGTVEIDDGRAKREATMTTPSAVEIAELLAQMRDAGCSSAAIEVSSHALHQDRVAGVRFAGAGFCNLTGDHLDYHQTMENYADAKARLFESLNSATVAVVNARDKWSGRMVRDTKARVVRYGFGPDADYQARDIGISANGTDFVLVGPDGTADVKMQLVGRHNIENALLASALVCEIFGLSVHKIAAGLRDAQGAPGRLQVVPVEGQPFAVLVDYAHTDDALENVLRALRPLCKGKLRVLFGCGGDRDRKKRPRMAGIAQKGADAVYVTSDNPRTENAAAIIEEIVAGFATGPGNSAAVVVEPDRRAAIERAIGDAEKGDIVLLAGKGHENYQIIGSEKHHFDDVEEATRVLRQKIGVLHKAADGIRGH
jgi:UDP-N-acetylmuramoyl-L-alanyl-D-glutamate--2,6-diaminopimelate ligase